MPMTRQVRTRPGKVVGSACGRRCALASTSGSPSWRKYSARTPRSRRSARRLIEGQAETGFVGDFDIKGKAEPQKVYRLDSVRTGATRFETSVFWDSAPMSDESASCSCSSAAWRRGSGKSASSTSWPNRAWANRGCFTAGRQLSRTQGRMQLLATDTTCPAALPKEQIETRTPQESSIIPPVWRQAAWACRLTALCASIVSASSVFFSSLSVVSKSPTASLKPSSAAHVLRVP
jgi:hypothetical protein